MLTLWHPLRIRICCRAGSLKKNSQNKKSAWSPDLLIPKNVKFTVRLFCIVAEYLTHDLGYAVTASK
jgi:hypothetical protein